MQKLKLTNDFIFKKVFGKKGNESILKNLLEAILKMKIEKIIKITGLTKEEVEEIVNKKTK